MIYIGVGALCVLNCLGVCDRDLRVDVHERTGTNLRDHTRSGPYIDNRHSAHGLAPSPVQTGYKTCLVK